MFGGVITFVSLTYQYRNLVVYCTAFFLPLYSFVFNLNNKAANKYNFRIISKMNHEIYINRCITLAQYSEGKTAPNPMVGAVLVYNDKVIGEGYHKEYGKTHAEVNAISSVKDKSLLKQSTLYVNLEPCSHYGKTPPCADLIIRSGIPRVVVGMRDVNPKVNGNGINMLRNAGIEVIEGVLENDCKYLNRRFVTFIEKKRPYILLKWAQTFDNFIDIHRYSSDVKPLKISNKVTKILNHQIRTQEAAIMVATRTAILDNPHLTVRKWSGRNPVRVLIDRNLKVPADFNIFDNSTRTLIFNQIKEETKANTEFIKLDFGTNIVPQILSKLYEYNIQSLIVEGGRQLLQSFVEYGCWDECHVEVSNQIIKNGVAAPILTNYDIVSKQILYNNSCFVYKNNII